MTGPPTWILRLGRSDSRLPLAAERIAKVLEQEEVRRATRAMVRLVERLRRDDEALAGGAQPQEVRASAGDE